MLAKYNLKTNTYLTYLSILIFSLALFTVSKPSFAHATYGSKLCTMPNYKCVVVKRGQSWASLFPNPSERMTVKKINRMNVPLRPGYRIAVPNGYIGSHMDYAPFPSKIAAPGKTVVKVNLRRLAWGAYDSSGNLVNWGPVAGGKHYCPDVKRACRTVEGSFTIYRKQGAGCKSSKYPRPNGGAPMPYCMHFHKGYALHASTTVPGHNASHGCVRMFHEDARWLNQSFIRVGSTNVKVTR